MKNIPIYLIELPETIRSERIKHQLQSLELNFQTIRAVDGKSLSSSDLSQLVDLDSCNTRLGYPMSLQLIGSGLSHRNVYKKALEANVGWALVLEEDVEIVNPEFFLIDMHLITELLDRDSRPAIVQLFSRGTRIVSTRKWKKLGHSFMLNFLPRLVGSGAPAYLINKLAIELACSTQVLDGVPDWPPWSKKFINYAVYPWPIIEKGNNSTVPQNWPSRYKFYLRRMQIMFLYYFIKNRRVYGNFRNFFEEEWQPLMIHTLWKLRGSNILKINEFDSGLQVFKSRKFDILFKAIESNEIRRG